MTIPFPLSPAPAYYAHCTFPTRNGVFYVGGAAPSITLSQATPNAYYVLDYNGQQVSSGTVTTTTVTPAPPMGGWKPGWYRVYFTGTQTDAVFGPSYGATNFLVIRPNSNLVAMPAVGTYGGAGNESRDLVMKGVLGMGTSRLLIGTAASPTNGGDSIAVCSTDAAVGETYWPLTADTARPRYLWTNFPNGSVDVLFTSNGTQFGYWLGCYPKDSTIDGSTVYIVIAAGTISGLKLLVQSRSGLGNPTGGAWPSIVGASGYVMFCWSSPSTGVVALPTYDVNSLPAGVTYSTSGAQGFAVGVAEASPPASWLLNSGSTLGASGTLFSDDAGDPMSVTFTWDGAHSFTGIISLYCFDNAGGRAQTISDGTTTITVSGFTGGRWVQFPETIAAGGSVTFTLQRTTGVNAVLGGVFFDAGATQTYTTLETYDNLAANNAPAASAAINAASAIIAAYPGAGTGQQQGVAPIGHAFYTGVAAAVAALYSAGVTRFEGPVNEPTLTGATGAEYAHQMMLFQAAVHAGNAAAKAIGPTPVSITTNLGGWAAFFAAGGGTYCDEIAFHDYNAITGSDINQGRVSITNFQVLLAQYGLSSKPLWQTEATQATTAEFGVYYARRGRLAVFQTILWEQYGLPRERNPNWYDVSHGFWSFPAFMENADTSLNSQCALYRTLAEETFGQTHSQQLDFGQLGNKIFLGSVYQASGGPATVVLMAASYMPNASITLTVTGTTGTLTVCDAFGNLSTVTIDNNGHAIVPVTDVPTYVRLPTSASVTVYSCNDWPPINSHGQGASSSIVGSVKTIGGAQNPVIADGAFMTAYIGGLASPGIAYSAASLPDTAVVLWPTATRLDRVIIWCGPPWQSIATLTDFDVQTTVDGTTWVTQATVTKSPAPASFWHGTDSQGVGCQLETYWDEQWIFDVKLPTPIVAKGIRLYVRATSYGGQPDNTAFTAYPPNVGGNGGPQRIVLEEIACVCDSNTYPQYVT